ncbi:hypothetical protein BDV27DRAFT_152796 [Aspergillus caelatus]|uniref:Uncharacterized protein n=1 Tax=Aspergillus caelatus TaxID=61420 RepID=A0A5N7AIZ5_9EURO|nr:uncharacterized protein BDV27DRAFT_152796 [Aspergillus caelatus]KAE8369715.1 hypothetical protein BDV27DRAFT_152796 [Aspergillus caelatus]
MATVLTAIVGIKAILLCLESRSKAAYLQPPYSKLPPESTSGIINLSLFWWLNALFRMGYRQLITTEDLFDIDPSLKADVIGREMQDAWNIRAKPEGQMALPKAVLFILRWNLFSVAVPRLCMIGFNFAQPFLITTAINYMDESEPHNKNVKYGLIGATFLIYFGIAISAAHYRRCFVRVLTKFRGSMIALLYNKSLTIQVGHCTGSAALTLMSTDIDNIIDLLENIVDIWARLVEIGIGIWLLARQIGAVCATPPIITAVWAIGQLWIAKSIGTDQQKWNESIQQRMRDISSMLGSMKAIKIAGLARPVARNVQDQRETELRIARAFFMGIMWLNGLANFPAIWSPVISFIVFSIQAKITGSQSLTSVRAFTSLSIIALVTAPAEKLLAVLPHIAAALGCFQRLQEYMLSDSMKDTRVFEPLIVSPFCDNEGDDDSLEGTPKSTDAIWRCDMSLVDLALPGALITVTASLFHCVARLALISTGSSYMALSIPFTVLTVFAVQHVYLKKSRQLRFLDSENKSPLYSHFLETLEGLSTLRALAWQTPAKQIQIVLVVALAIEMRSTTSGGLIGVSLNNVLSFNQSLSTFVTAWTSLETSLGAIARVKTLSKMTPNENKPDENKELPERCPETGAIEIDRVSVKYANGANALSDVTIKISPGQKIGLCGRTGSGKSSLILSLLRLVDICEGTIVIDGVDIGTISREQIRERLVSIPQDPFILSSTIRNNADPMRTATDEEIILALQRIGIWNTLESRGGLDAVLLDHPLSQGQQQLFCLARAILRRPDSRILILDEATSSVDSDTDAAMQKVIKEVFAGCTIISVAHRLNTIMDSDMVALLDGGKLVEFDSPGSLLARDSIFRRMYQK